MPIKSHYFPKSSGQSSKIKKMRHLIDQEGGWPQALGEMKKKVGIFRVFSCNLVYYASAYSQNISIEPACVNVLLGGGTCR